MFLGRFPQLQQLYSNNEITEGLNVLSQNCLQKSNKSSLAQGFRRSLSQPAVSILDQKDRQLRIVHRFQVLPTISDSDTMNNEDSDQGLHFKRPGQSKNQNPSTSKHSERQREEDINKTVFVGNISYRMTVSQLKRFFTKFGLVKEVRLLTHRINKSPKCIAFITFLEEEGAVEALEAPNHLLKLDKRVMRIHRALKERGKVSKGEVEPQNCAVSSSDSNAGSSLENNPSSLEDTKEDPEPVEENAVLRLTDDALAIVFSHLPLDDLYTAQHVCHQWKTVAARCWASKRVLDFANVFSGFGKPLMSDTIFQQILHHCGRNVRAMNLSNVSRFLTKRSMELIAHKCGCLEKLDLSGSDVTMVEIKLIAKCCKDLREIVLSRCSQISEKGFWWLLRLSQNLTHLEISHNLRITGKCFHHISGNLTILNLANCSKIIDSGFEKIGEQCKMLVDLTLNNCVSLTNPALRKICSGCPNLRKLSMSGVFTDITSEGIGYIGLLEKLGELNLSRNDHVDDNSLILISRGCRKLEVLDISNCWETVSDASLEKFRDCPNLRRLDISYLFNVTDITLFTLARVGRLEEVIARGNMSVYKEGCQELVRLCSCLRLLDLSGCENVVGSLLESCLQAVATREGGPRLTVITGGTGIDTSKVINHQWLNIDSSDLSIRPLCEEYIPDQIPANAQHYGNDPDEDEWGEDGLEDFNDPMLAYERENPA